MTFCIAGFALFTISLLSFSNVLYTIFSLMFILTLPFMYQFGVDHLDFKNAENMFEFEWGDEDDEDKDK